MLTKECGFWRCSAKLSGVLTRTSTGRMNCSPIAAANGVAPFGPVVEGFEDDEEVDVAVGAGVAAGVAAEEDDLLGVEFLGDQPGNGLNCGSVDWGFGHLRETLLRMFCGDPD